MSSITTRAAKGSALTHAEVDANFTNLNSGKAEISGQTFTGPVVLPAGTAAAPGIAFTGDPNSGIYSSGADQISFATNGTERLRVDSAGQIEAVSLGTAAAPTFSFVGDPNTGIYSPGADQLAISTGGSGRLFVDASGNVGVATSSPGAAFHVAGTITSTPTGSGLLAGLNSNYSQVKLYGTTGGLLDFGASGADATARIRVDNANGDLQFHTGSSSEKVRITAAGLVGIGTTSPNQALEVNGFIRGGSYQFGTSGTGVAEYIGFGNSNGPTLEFYGSATGLAGAFVAKTAGTERLRIDSSGRLLVGTSSVTGIPATLNVIGGNNTVLHSQSATADSPFLFLSHARGTGVQSVNAQDGVGAVAFVGYDGTNALTAARIEAFVDGTPGANDMPGRLVFSTTADGASSPTERLRITQNGSVLIGKTSNPGDLATTGTDFGPGYGIFTRDGGTPLYVNRKVDDGNLVEFYQASTVEGTISVSGTTVSYNGAHLSRWSQLPSGAERTEILRGSVLSNIDEMCEWGNEDNEQLNRMKVSNVEGDKNVSGVFQAWDDDDDTYTNDFYCAMTGDFIIRIAEGITVERGDLLMSAGDGTAKPQDDDIIRSKTIAKVTSTNVSCIYADGSYCVPCVLMAC